MSACHRAAALLAALLLAMPAFGNEPPDGLSRFVFPDTELSSKDDVFVLYADNCGRPHPDAARPAEISADGALVKVDVFLVALEEEFCLAVVQPDRLHAIPVGPLPIGERLIQRRLWVRSSEGTEYRLAADAVRGLWVGDAPHASASGVWFSPTMPGNGLVLNILPGEPGGAALAVVFLASRDASGAPEWLSGVGEFIDAQLRVPLRRANTAPEAPADAVAAFDYLGCGEAEFSVSGMQLAFPAGIERVQQMTANKGVQACRPPALRPADLD